LHRPHRGCAPSSKESAAPTSIPGGKGLEVEEVLRKFLNAHLPRRYSACSGVMIDVENHMSKQTDVMVYDALSSPEYRASEQLQIVPADAVASVIEVKSCLTPTYLIHRQPLSHSPTR
jgi:hypothetical protein